MPGVQAEGDPAVIFDILAICAGVGFVVLVVGAGRLIVRRQRDENPDWLNDGHGW